MPVITDKLKPSDVQPYRFKAKDDLMKQIQKKNFVSQPGTKLLPSLDICKH